MSDTEGYNGWSNRDTWAMGLNLDNDYDIYHTCQSLARRAAVGNEEDVEAFYDELAGALETFGRYCAREGLLPDFDPDTHMSPDPKDNHGPDDVEGVNWRELAEAYEISDYV